MRVVIIVGDRRVQKVLAPFNSDVEIEIVNLDTDVQEVYERAQKDEEGYSSSPDYKQIY